MRKTRQKTTATILRHIRRNRPVTPAQWAALGVKFTVVGRGVFREVCRIKGTDLVVKSPLYYGKLKPGQQPDYSEGIAHAKSEMARLSRLQKIDVLRPFLPKVFWYDAKSGQTVMSYYPPIPEKQKVTALGKIVKSLVSRLYGITLGDIHEDNLRQKSSDWKIPVLVDLGY